MCEYTVVKAVKPYPLYGQIVWRVNDVSIEQLERRGPVREPLMCAVHKLARRPCAHVTRPMLCKPVRGRLRGAADSCTGWAHGAERPTGHPLGWEVECMDKGPTGAGGPQHLLPRVLGGLAP